MKKSLILGLFIILITLSGCDDFYRNVDGISYRTLCRSRDDGYTLVELNEDNLIGEMEDSELIVGHYNELEYYYDSPIIYDYYLVQIGGYKGEYYPILDAIELDSNVLEFVVVSCFYEDGFLNKRPIDNEAPTIIPNGEPEVMIGYMIDSESLIDFFIIEDNHFDFNELVIETNYWDVNPNNNIGTFNITMTVSDPNGNSTSIDFRLKVTLDYFYLIENLNVDLHNIVELEYFPNNTGYLEGETIVIHFYSGDVLHINQKGHFRYEMDFTDTYNGHVVFSGLNIRTMENVSLKVVVGNIDEELFTSGGNLGFNLYEEFFGFDSVEEIYQYDYPEYDFLKPEIFLEYVNFHGVTSINRVKYFYQSVLGINMQLPSIEE